MLSQDIRQALRSLWGGKSFAIVALLCLAFGVGLNTTIFSIVDGVLLKPFPYADPERIVILRSTNATLRVSNGGVSYLDWRDLQAGTQAFSSIAALQNRSLALSDDRNDPARYAAAAVSWDLFPLLGIAPILGGGFTPEMDQPGAPTAVLLGFAVWRDRYDSDPNIPGRKVTLNGAPAVIVGVMPEHFEFPNTQKIWIPLTPSVFKEPRHLHDLQVFARIAPGATLASAHAELAARSASLQQQFPKEDGDWTIGLQTLRERFIPANVSLVILLMMASVTLVLAIACSNVANLQLARAATRQREFSLRTALGANRAQIIRQLLTESVVLSVISLPFALVLAQIGTRLISSAMPPDQVPYYITWSLDARSFLYAFAVAVGTAVVFGLLPALQASRSNLVESLKDGGRGTGTRHSRLRSTLVVAQVALAVVSLVAALLFVRTFSNLDAYAIGFDPKSLMTMRFYLPGDAYEADGAKARRVQDIVNRVEALSTVEAAFASNLLPLNGGGGGYGVVPDGKAYEPGHEPIVNLSGISPHFHRTLGVSLIAGRELTDIEAWSSQPLAIVNKTMADQFWPDSQPVGARFRVTGDSSFGSGWFTVIGVAPDVKHDNVNPNTAPFAAAYVPYAFQQTFSTALVIRVSGNPTSITPAVREAIKASDPNLPVAFVRTMDEVRQGGYWQYAIFGWIFGVTGIVGLLLASVGVFGVLSYHVTQRTNEIGVRMALGAGRPAVLRLIVGHGLRLAGAGVLLGLALAPAGTWFGRTLFYNVSPFDPLTFGAVAGFLLAVAVLASYVPALRATTVDPVRALRGE
ncbi:MAG TPA: ABC transporter permease [Vicinamibacterales bacterium]|nr:ABC transporter permease [Vicinamibacterales bacterium]